jgi:hypothetical protein
MSRAILSCGLLLVTGCVTQSLGLAAGEPMRPTSPAEIELFDSEATRPYEPIGVVHAHCRTNWLAAAFNCREGAMRDALRMRAGELGAHAVVDIDRSGFWQIEWSDVHLRGKAVRWLDEGTHGGDDPTRDPHRYRAASRVQTAGSDRGAVSSSP